LKTPANRILLVITLFMHLLSAAYWAYRVADVMSRIQFWLENPQTLQAAHTPVTRWTPLFNASVLLNVGTFRSRLLFR
jgi:hypothetical protein